jgi:hypothetical protein
MQTNRCPRGLLAIGGGTRFLSNKPNSESYHYNIPLDKDHMTPI